MRTVERRKVNDPEMKCLRSLVGVSRMDIVRNEEVRRRAGIESELEGSESIEMVIGHVERMDEYHIAKGCRWWI